jgi:AcrR family transcriptional regulator
MANALSIKEKIINAAAELIEKSEGNMEAITIRAISEKAGVGVGLLNYHFQTKEHLIETCVQKIIGDVIKEYRPKDIEGLSRLERLKLTVKSVADFLIANPSVSRISVLSDYKSPQLCDNTMKTVQGFLSVFDVEGILDKGKKIISFMLTSVLQALFLRKDISKALFGYDFYNKTERDTLLDLIVERLYGEG